MWVYLVKGRGSLCLSAVIRVGGGGKRCDKGVSLPNCRSAASRHSHVVVVVSWEVAAHVKCDRALAALRLDKAHSRYPTTFFRSDWNHVMFAGTCSHQCAPTSSKSSALAKPFNPAHGPPFKWLYSSSSTAKFQSAMSVSTLKCRCLLRQLLLTSWTTHCNTAPRQRRESEVRRRNSKLEQKHIGAADQPYGEP